MYALMQLLSMTQLSPLFMDLINSLQNLYWIIFQRIGRKNRNFLTVIVECKLFLITRIILTEIPTHRRSRDIFLLVDGILSSKFISIYRLEKGRSDILLTLWRRQRNQLASTVSFLSKQQIFARKTDLLFLPELP